MYQPYILKYDYSGLIPHISKKTMEVHYNGHYLKYLKNLNEILEKNNYSFKYPISWIFDNIDVFPIKDRDTIIYNAGGVSNHELYFDSMSPKKDNYIPEPLNSALVRKFGSVKHFYEQLSDLALDLPGSGYTFLTVKNGELYLLNLANQDSPYSFGMVPILAFDIWEHAYYLDRYNDRKTYIEEFLKVIDFTNANKIYQKSIKKS